MDFIDKANQESYSSNFIKPSLKKYIDIHFYDKLLYYCVVFLWICYVNNTIHRFKNKIANLSTINREKKMSLGAWTRVDRVEDHHSNHKATGAFAQKPKIKKIKKKQQILYSAFSTSKKTATKKKHQNPHIRFLNSYKVLSLKILKKFIE